MAEEAEQNEPTIVPVGEAALITNGGMTGFEIALPNGVAETDTVPELAVFLAAVMMRADKELKFIDDMIEWFERMAEKMEGKENE